MFENGTWFYPVAAPLAMPIGMQHLDSSFCWCDPVIEVDEDGQGSRAAHTSNVELKYHRKGSRDVAQQ
jgi:hypothetical protein